MRLDELDSTASARLLELLDEALTCAPEKREAWLDGLSHVDPAIVAMLREVLRSVRDGDGDGFLETRGLLARQIAPATCAGTWPGKPCGPYRLLRPLGYGGMGVVWLAERADGLFARQVALKLVHPRLAGSTADGRFGRERAILAGLAHPHITRLLDAGFTGDGQPYLALEYVDGTPLIEWCDRERVSVRSRLELFRQVLSAVQYAHANLVVHR